MPFPLWKRQLGQLAQLVEHRPYKAGATGSSPVLPTKENQNHPHSGWFFCYIHSWLKPSQGGRYRPSPFFLSHTALTYRQGRSVDMMRAHPGGDGEDTKDSHRGPPYFYVGKFCFFSIFVLSNQTYAGMPDASRMKWSGCGRLSVFFQLDSCEGNNLERRSISCCRGPAVCSVAGCQHCRQLFGRTVSSSWKVVRILAVFDILSYQYILFFRYFP